MSDKRTLRVATAHIQNPREVKKLRIFCAPGVKLAKSRGVNKLKIPSKWLVVARKNGVSQIDGVTLISGDVTTTAQ